VSRGQIIAGPGVVRPKWNHLIELLHRHGVQSLPVEKDSELIMRFGIVGVNLAGSLEQSPSSIRVNSRRAKTPQCPVQQLLEHLSRLWVSGLIRVCKRDLPCSDPQDSRLHPLLPFWHPEMVLPVGNAG
jgi:hypothetical protein